MEFPGVCLRVFGSQSVPWESVSLAFRAAGKVRFGQNCEYQGCGRGEGKFLIGGEEIELGNFLHEQLNLQIVMPRYCLISIQFPKS